MGPMHEKVRGWILTVAKRKPKAVDPTPAAVPGEVRHPVAPPRSAPAHPSLSIRIDHESGRAMTPSPVPRHDSGIHPLSPLRARSESHAEWEGPFEDLNPFDKKVKP